MLLLQLALLPVQGFHKVTAAPLLEYLSVCPFVTFISSEYHKSIPVCPKKFANSVQLLTQKLSLVTVHDLQ